MLTDIIDENEVSYSWVPRENETLVNTIEGVQEFLPHLLAIKPGPPELAELFCDLEGFGLGKPPGTISLLQITIKALMHTWIFDVTVLGKKVFNTMGSRGQSIRGVLASKIIWKAWWDAGNDANALLYHYQIELAKVLDLQYLELVTRKGKSRMCRLGLGDAVKQKGEASGNMTKEEVSAWLEVQDAGKRFFKNNPLGYLVFDQRPMLKLVMRYAGQDTIHMPMLLDA